MDRARYCRELCLVWTLSLSERQQLVSHVSRHYEAITLDLDPTCNSTAFEAVPLLVAHNSVSTQVQCSIGSQISFNINVINRTCKPSGLIFAIEDFWS
jgi:hypothetical protein